MKRVIRREALNIRIRSDVRGLIDHAAAMTGKTRTDFVLESAQRAAENAILDRTIFTAGPRAYREFLEFLDAPPSPNARLRKTMLTAAPWEK